MRERVCERERERERDCELLMLVYEEKVIEEERLSFPCTCVREKKKLPTSCFHCPCLIALCCITLILILKLIFNFSMNLSTAQVIKA